MRRAIAANETRSSKSLSINSRVELSIGCRVGLKGKLSSTVLAFEPLFSLVSASIFDLVVRVAFRAVHSSCIE